MKRLGSVRNAAAVVILGGLVAAVVAVATAQAAPSKKNYTVVVAVTKPAAGDPVNPKNFTVTIKNDPSSNTTLGSANVTLPTGFTADSASTSQLGWSNLTSIATDSNGTSTVQLRSDASSHALAVGASMTVSVHVSLPASLPTTGCNATWSSTAKQSNDYLGTNNWFTLLGSPSSDLQPLGSFVFSPVQSTVGPNNAQVPVPQILTTPPAGNATQIRIQALDTCGNPDLDYSGATLNKEAGFGLVNATFSNLTWSTTGGLRVGSATLSPVDVEVGDQFTVNDPTTGIFAKSSSTGGRPTFDVVETICSAGQTCNWNDKNNPIKSTSTVPGDAGALGLGYQPFSSTSVTCGTTSYTPVGDIVRIDPYNYATGSTLIVVITYDKSLVGTGPASSLNVCKTTDNGSTWLTLAACSNTPVAPCVDVAKVSGGNFQATLYLNPADPGAGGLK